MKASKDIATIIAELPKFRKNDEIASLRVLLLSPARTGLACFPHAALEPHGSLMLAFKNVAFHYWLVSSIRPFSVGE